MIILCIFWKQPCVIWADQPLKRLPQGEPTQISEGHRSSVITNMSEYQYAKFGHRNQIRAHIAKLRRQAKEESEMTEKCSGMTAADLLKLGSFLVAISHVMDKIMLIARVINDDSYEARESRISNLKALDGTRRDLSHDQWRVNSSDV